MQAEPTVQLRTGYALFDAGGMLVEANDAFFGEESAGEAALPALDFNAAVGKALSRFQSFDGMAIEAGDAFTQEAAAAWCKGDCLPIEAQTSAGRWKLLTSHERAGGGIGLVSADITEMKRAQAAYRQAETAEREATVLMRQVLDACPAPTRMTSFDGQTLYRNPASRELYGDRPRISDHYVDQADRQRMLDSLMSNGHVNDFPMRHYRADGTIFWAAVSARVIEFRGQQVIVSNTTNITDLVEAREQTRQASERLIDAIESLAEGFALYDNHDRLVMANSRYRQMHAMSADALVPGVNWFDFLRVTAERKQFPVAPDRIDEWLAERARDRREFRQQEFRHTSGDWYYVSNCPTRDGGFVVTRMDITERKRAELAAKEADELVRRVLEACPVSIQMTRLADGKLLYRSPASAELLGEAPTALDSYVDLADRQAYIAELLRDGKVDELKIRLRRRDGQPIWCSMSSRLIDFHGEQVIVAHIYDLTDQIRMQHELEQQRETLHQNEKIAALGGLLAGVAHELNNPLSVVLGQSLLMKESAPDAKSLERADKIGRAAERCTRIVKTFLAMARQQPARSSNMQVDEIITAAVEVAGYSIRSSDVELSLKLAPQLPPIWADPDQLSQVLINLLVNAEQALHGWDGPRRITVTTAFEPRGGNVVVKVADTGPGIPRDIRSRIFEPFFTTKEVGSGTGIGLSFCHRIVQSHGGTIHVESEDGAGTAFIMALPASGRQDSQRQETIDEETPDEPGQTCLVVDDERAVGELIADILERAGFRVVIAESGEEALAQLGQRTFALILSDLKMPNMDGRRLFKHICDDHPAEVEKLAFLTGDTMSPDAQAFLRGAKRPYIEKPVKPAELRSFVAKMVNRSAQTAEIN